jgi:hypothetical protein
LIVSDKTTALIERDHLSDLIHATMEPAIAVSPYTIPRARIDKRPGEGTVVDGDTDHEPSVSPVAVMFVIAMLGTLFAAIVQL